MTLHRKIKFSIKDFFSKCNQIRSFLAIWSHLLKNSLMENFIFCAVWVISITLVDIYAALLKNRYHLVSWLNVTACINLKATNEIVYMYAISNKNIVLNRVSNYKSGNFIMLSGCLSKMMSDNAYVGKQNFDWNVV